MLGPMIFLAVMGRTRRGRWNAPGIYAIYGSLEPGLPADESFNFLLRHFGWQSRDVPPRMLVGIRVSLRAVLDLTNLKCVLTPLEFGILALRIGEKQMASERKAALRR
jgi:hypothetical protein